MNPNLGQRQHFELTLMGAGAHGFGNNPPLTFRSQKALYVGTPEIVYSVVPWEQPNDIGFSEIAWTSLGNIRLWGALAFSIREGQGFYSFEPVDNRSLYFKAIDEPAMRRVAERLAADHTLPNGLVHGRAPDPGEVRALYDAMQNADTVLLRGVSCYLKSHLLWDRRGLFLEEMGFNLYIALEAGLNVLRQRLSYGASERVSFQTVFDFVRATFAYGDALAEYWQDAHNDRNALLHPANEFSPYVIQPMYADDIMELFDPMLSLYRFILIGDPRPSKL